MVQQQVQWIIGKGKEWLRTYGQGTFLQSAMWSNNLWDARRFDSVYSAKRIARRYVGSMVYEFNAVTGSVKPCKPPEDACCDNCMFYAPNPETCENVHSINAKQHTDKTVVCDEWEAKL